MITLTSSRWEWTASRDLAQRLHGRRISTGGTNLAGAGRSRSGVERRTFERELRGSGDGASG